MDDGSISDDDLSSMAATVAVESQPAVVGHLDDALAEMAVDERYERRLLLGEGGMGEVHLCADQRIGREIAMKVLRPGSGSSSAGNARFVREARVQGQLEHPTVVPVYDLGLTSDGAEFFTMKRVSGVTLEDALQQLRSGDGEAERTYSRNKLLGIFRQVCLGVHYAHTRGVIHRDLKPGNIMMGNYGEVYVIDWGLAKVRDADGDGVASDATATLDGAVLGTPGYMPAEQALSSASVDERADVYALGAILFEILTLEPLHEGQRVHDLLRSTQAGVDVAARMEACARDVPPELQRVCAEATRTHPRERLASAQALAEGVEAFLEGDRDLALRRQLAARHASKAHEAARNSLALGGSAHDARVLALREAGRALALDPEHAGASQVLARLLLEPPAVLPEDARAEVEETSVQEAVRFLRDVTFAMGAFILMVASVLLSPIRSWFGFAVLAAPVTLACAYGVWLYGNHQRVRNLRRHTAALAGLASLSVAATSGLYGPLVLTPLFAVVLVVLSSTLEFLRGYRLLGVAVGFMTIAVPVVLEVAGVIPPSYAFEDGGMVVIPRIREISRLSVNVALMVSAVTVVVIGLVMWRFSRELEEKRRRLHITTWHLRQLVPVGAPEDTSAPHPT